VIPDLRVEEVRRVANFIEKSIQMASWNQTKAFIAAASMDGKQPLTLLGRGNPLGKGHGFAYVSIIKEKKKGKEEKKSKVIHFLPIPCSSLSLSLTRCFFVTLNFTERDIG
jgi:hypothetical protein